MPLPTPRWTIGQSLRQLYRPRSQFLALNDLNNILANSLDDFFGLTSKIPSFLARFAASFRWAAACFSNDFFNFDGGSTAAKHSNLIAMSKYSAINFIAASLSHRVAPRNHATSGRRFSFENLIISEAPTQCQAWASTDCQSGRTSAPRRPQAFR
jgi:hypothetical protein